MHSNKYAQNVYHDIAIMSRIDAYLGMILDQKAASGWPVINPDAGRCVSRMLCEEYQPTRLVKM